MPQFENPSLRLSPHSFLVGRESRYAVRGWFDRHFQSHPFRSTALTAREVCREINCRMTKTAEITTRDLRERFGTVRKRLERGQSLVVTSHGQPVAFLTPWNVAHSFIGATAGGPPLPAELDETTGEKW